MQECEAVRRLKVGVYDAPLEQKQPILEIDLLNDNIAVFGAKQSGKTTFVKNVLVRLHEIFDPTILDEEIYILDLNSTMGDYEKLPCICGCFDGSNEEDVKTLFKTAEDRLKRNNELLKTAKRSSIMQFLQDTPEYMQEEKPKHITIIIENMNAFLAEERLTLYHELLLKFCRDGISKGLTVIFTANGISGGVSRYLANMETIMAFNMPSDQVTEIFNEKPPQLLSVPGRGIVKKNASLYEFQGFLPFESEKSELPAFLSYLQNRLSDTYHPAHLISFSKYLTTENFSENTYSGLSYPEAVNRANGIVVGLDYYHHVPVVITPSESRSIAIYGKKSFGKTNLLNLLVGSLLLRDNEQITHVVMFDDGRRELEGLAEYITNSTKIHLHQFNDRTNFCIFIYDFYKKIVYQAEKKPAALPEKLPETTAVPKNQPFSTPAMWGSSGSVMSSLIPNHVAQQIMQQPQPEPPPTDKIEELPEEKSDINGTLFIIQSRALFQKSKDELESNLQALINNADQNNLMFIFSDVKKHPDTDMEGILRTMFGKAFLLNDIADFVNDKGSTTVFGEFEARELKMEYAKCELGDGYYFDVERDELTKVKFMKSPFNIKEKNAKS